MGWPVPQAVIAGASLVGLMAAVRLREVGYDVVVVDRDPLATGRATDLDAPPLPLQGAEADAFARWAERSSMYPRTAGAGGTEATTVDLGAWWSAAQADAIAVGVAVRANHRVVGVAADGGRVAAVRTDQGPVPADVLIVAAGADAIGITPALGVQLPVVPEAAAWCTGPGAERGAVVRAVDPKGVAPDSVHAALALRDARGATWFGAYRSFGAAGPRRERIARAYLERVIEADGGAATPGGGTLVWQRHPHCTVDHRPVVGALPSVPGLVLALPHGPFGNAVAVAVAEAAVRAATGAAPRLEDAAWSPERFPQGASGGRMKAVA